MGVIALCVSVAAGGPLVGLLRQRRLGKEISTDGPASHLAKAGTPTMGGLLILATALPITLAGNVAGRLSILLPLGAMMAAGAIGLADDALTLRGRQRIDPHSRLFGLAKFLAFAILGLTVGLVLYYPLEIRETFVPWVGQFDVGLWYVPVVVFVVVGTIVSLALTDGLDGLAGGTTAIAFLAYGAIALAQEQTFLATFAFTMVGALLGFLWYNSHPAQVFMGETGALALGAALATTAFMTGHWLLLPIIGVVLVAETLSVMMQVIYFKLTRGQRLFRMSPIHHHFELLGWSEQQVVLRFWLVGALGATVGVALALTD
ncbi:MAG: phospho-N-acetylmuramoyl-pentapeptide-transferase [Dehalococcoidia bacterium]